MSWIAPFLKPHGHGYVKYNYGHVRSQPYKKAINFQTLSVRRPPPCPPIWNFLKYSLTIFNTYILNNKKRFILIILHSLPFKNSFKHTLSLKNVNESWNQMRETRPRQSVSNSEYPDDILKNNGDNLVLVIFEFW